MCLLWNDTPPHPYLHYRQLERIDSYVHNLCINVRHNSTVAIPTEVWYVLSHEKNISTKEIEKSQNTRLS